MTSVLVTGAGGFIGGHLVARLRRRVVEHDVRGVDRVPVDQWHQRFDDVDNRCADLQDPIGRVPQRQRGRRRRLQPRRRHGRHGVHREQQGPVHAVGPDQDAHARCGRDRPACSASSTPRRPASTRPDKQESPEVEPLREADAYPAMPEDGYGWEKLFSERMCRPLLRGLRPRDPRRPLPQRLRPERHLRRAAARRRRPPSAARWPTAVARAVQRDRDLGRRQADAQLHLHRRLRRRHAAADGQRRPRAAQHRLGASW